MTSKSSNARGKKPSCNLRLPAHGVVTAAKATSCKIADQGFRRLVEVVPEGITIYQDGRIVYANQAAAELLGARDPKEILGRSGFEFVAPDDRERIRAQVRNLHEGALQSLSARLKRIGLDGVVRDVEVVVVRIIWNGRLADLGLARDITARMLAEERLDGVLATGIHWLWETDAEHRFCWVSEGPSRPYRFYVDMIDKTRWELVGGLEDDVFWRDHVATLNAMQPFDNFVYWNRVTGGVEICASVSGTPIFDAHGAFTGYRGIASDITERKLAERTIEHMALHDALTDLPNRVYFANELERACHAAKRDGTKLAVLFLDLDHFKEVNDTLGHSVGDKLLIEIAARMKSCLRGGDLVARFGGDEFVMVVSQSHDPTSIGHLADRIVEAIDVPCDIDGITVDTSISIGVATYPDDGLDPERLLAHADLALYAAKRAGRHTWRVFDRHLQKQLQTRRSLDHELRLALDLQQFELHYQPLVDIADRYVTGFEALVRWNHPERGQTLPAAFISATERNRLIVPLTEWVLEAATTQLQRWAASGLGKHKIAVNVSPVLLRLQSFVDLFDRCLARTGCHPRSIVIEVTEEAILDEGKVISILTALRERGVTIAIDDFGTGYSSMARLRTLPIDILKIDRMFLASAPCNVSDAAIVESLVNIGHGLGKQVVAEGVETTEQLTFLNDIGCDIAQGYLINPPMAAADIPPWFERWRSRNPARSGQRNDVSAATRSGQHIL